MSSNEFLFTISDYGIEHDLDYQYQLPAWYYILVTIFPIIIFSGIFSNVLGLVITARSRMWRGHEGYVYLTAIFCANIAILIFEPGVYWLMSVDLRFYPWYASSIVQNILQVFKTIIYSCGWLSVALMFNVYLRERQSQSSRCGCSPSFATKYCTLRATKIIVGIIFGFIFGYAVLYLVAIIRSIESHYNHSFIWMIRGDIFILVEFLLMWVIPFIFFLPVVLLLAVCRKRPTEGRTVDDDQFRKAALILSSMTFFIQFVLVVVGISLQIIRSISSYNDDLLIDSYMFFIDAFELALSLSLAVQPVICILVIKQFKDGFYSVMPCCKGNSQNYAVSRQDPDQEIQLAENA